MRDSGFGNPKGLKLRAGNGGAEGTLDCGGSTPPWISTSVVPRKRRAAIAPPGFSTTPALGAPPLLI